MRTTITSLIILALTGILTGCEPAPPPPVDYIIGDSNTVEPSWATQLAADCRPDTWAWGGTGILRSGYTGGVGTLTLNDNAAQMMAGRTGDNVVVMLGTNDALGRKPLPTLADLNRLAAELQTNGAATVRWATIPPFSSSIDSTTRARRNTLNATILQANSVDLRGAFGTTLTSTQHIGDGIHLNANGHATLGYYGAVYTNICG